MNKDLKDNLILSDWLENVLTELLYFTGYVN